MCFFEARHYAPFYLNDFVNAILYTDSQVLSKVCHYELARGIKRPLLLNPGLENTYAFEVNTRAMLISRSLLKVVLDDSPEDPSISIKKAVLSRRLSCYFTDRFNYLKNGGIKGESWVKDQQDWFTV